MANRFYQFKDGKGLCVDLETVAGINPPNNKSELSFLVIKGGYSETVRISSNGIDGTFTNFVAAWREYLNDKG
jgi:hypothetical protein